MSLKQSNSIVIDSDYKENNNNMSIDNDNNSTTSSSIQQQEDNVNIDSIDLENLQNCSLIPYISHFTWLFQKQLNMYCISTEQLEYALINHNNDITLYILLSRLLLTRIDRNKLNRTEYWSYNVCCEIIHIAYAFWFDQLDILYPNNDDNNNKRKLYNNNNVLVNDVDVTTELKYSRSIRTRYNNINPLQHTQFNELSSIDKANVIASLCDYYLNDENLEFTQYLRTLEPSHCRVDPITIDTLNDYAYYFFGFNDYRVYRSKIPKLKAYNHSLQRQNSNTINNNNDEEFILLTHNSDELNKYIKQLKNSKGKTESTKQLIQSLTQVYELCNNQEGHITKSINDELDNKQNKKSKFSTTVQPTRGSARLTATIELQQQKLQQQALLEEQKKLKRINEIQQRSIDYIKELLNYYRELTKAIHDREDNYNED